MALPPKFSGMKLLLNDSPKKTLHTIELYLDYVCPFSAKQFKTLYTQFLPKVSKTAPYASNVQFIFRPQIQPWHPSSTLVHEAAIAVARVAPSKFWEFSERLFEKQTEYFDVNVVNEGRNQTYKRLAKLAGEVGVGEEEIYGLLKVSDKPAEDGSTNVGNKVTDDLKQCIKMARLTGVHVSPTVVFNGWPEGSISSSFTGDQWAEWLEKNCSQA